MTAALPGGQTQRRPDLVEPANNLPQTGLYPGMTSAPSMRRREFQSITAELVALLPPREVAALLVDTYFDRIHWFMLIFHQDDFRQTWQQLYDEQPAGPHPGPGFTSVFLVVIAIALQYTGDHRKQLLQTYNIDPTAQRHKILSFIRAKLLDIVSLGSLEAVQTCILLGTYYLYHGNPGLAWPVCGCGLRIAQALNLHRKSYTTGPISPAMSRQYETRKRCWWAIYEIETFCSMSYGYPHGIKDADCDVELLDPLAKFATSQPTVSFDAANQCPASLLSYKCLMSKLSVIIKDILTGLYGRGSCPGTTQRGRLDSKSSLHSLIRKVSGLDIRLQKWKEEIHSPLHLDDARTSSATYTSAEGMDRDIGASGPEFENHIYRLQALALEFAYENARILVHRPLLSFKTISRGDPDLDDDSEVSTRNPLQLSLQACRDAALRTSEIGANSIFSLAADTYAAAFLGIHTFTAGVMLCILASIEPLSPHSYQTKMGLRKLLRMQVHLKARSKSALAAQGLDILERLTKLVMEKELKEMLTCSGNEVSAQAQDLDIGHLQSSQNVTETVGDQAFGLAEASTTDATMFNYIEDPTMSQALCDFDRVLSDQGLDAPPEPLFPDLFGPGSITQEQAWIWGVNSLAQFPDVGTQDLPADIAFNGSAT
ncbi:fungal-specific transcription factor domain-containing protein [Penicillium canariense]|uniref:Fungal-specific transcription factor domain-containing protein n=1 Tax=Penicillium canariense TaxID=189055 RepID=A0A9W9HZH7_9EURO|nr:fungal-specific transcription factor domain-containing protein [Penicillium canariense]KAJ5160663.1 fungal-specific transcription factor domain-containing protein [Penicillium canariense]